MDIVNRLKTYMEARSISVTQFADTCGIPRPSLSQLLSGRNRKISDEVVAKIHRGYPGLSMMWLMFGEGAMCVDGDDLAPVPHQTALPHLDDADDEDVAPAIVGRSTVVTDPLPSSADPATKRSDAGRIDFGFACGVGGDISEYSPKPRQQTPEAPAVTSITATTTPEPAASVGGKRVVSIVVYYDDNSYESFVPSGVKAPFGRNDN